MGRALCPDVTIAEELGCLCAGAGTELVHTGDTAAAIVAIMNMIFA